jgi:signal transduction histidine kinase
MNRVRLLLVDDEAVFLKTLADRLKKRGIPVMTADGGRRCLEVLADHPMDVVVLDIRMPDLDGMEVLREVRAHHPETEVIFLTGHGSTADGVAGIKAGAFDYLTKPVELEHLLKKIRQAREKKSRDRERREEAARRSEMEKRLAAAERMAALGVLASGVAHEINNPLAIIHGWCELLGSLIEGESPDFPLREEFERGFEKIDLAVKRAKLIIQKLLGVIQKSAGAVEEISPAGMMESAMALVMPAALEKGVTLVGPSALCPESLMADPYPIRQVLLNILNNATDATPTGGTVTCSVSTCEGDILFRVEDTGPGIPPEIMEKIFDPFFTTKPVGEGAGLGLYVSRQIVGKLGGRIEAENVPGRGAVFTVRLSALSLSPRVGDARLAEKYAIDPGIEK